MEKYTIDKTKYSEYRDTKSGLHFIIDKNEEQKFRTWVNEYEGVDNIPEEFCLTGYYLKENTDGIHEWWGENDVKNESIPANKTTFPIE